MIDIKSKRCIENNCYKYPIFNFPTEKKNYIAQNINLMA